MWEPDHCRWYLHLANTVNEKATQFHLADKDKVRSCGWS